MSDDKPRPQYGEYATPEEQRAQIRDPQARKEIGWVHAGHPPGGPEPAHQPQMPPQPSQQHPAQRYGEGVPAPAARVRTRRRWDVVLTLLLLAVGLINVLTSIPSYLNLAGSLHSVYKDFGVGASPDGTLVAGAGVALIVIESIVWILAALLSWLSLARARISFWIPIVGAIVAYLGVIVVLLVVVLNDPAFLAFVQTPH